MPELCRFDGIRIRMYTDDHNPPHFHVIYSEYNASFGVASLEKIEGDLPRRIERRVRKWASKHKPELEENWHLIQSGCPSRPIESTE